MNPPLSVPCAYLSLLLPFRSLQGLANKWIRSMEKEAGLLVVKLTDGNYLRTLENAIQVGSVALPRCCHGGCP
jgi:hypothetical protein